MIITKKRHHSVVDRLEAEKAALQAALQEERSVSERLAAQVVHSIVAKCQAEDALDDAKREAETTLSVALKGAELAIATERSAAELALLKYGEAVG